VQRVSSNHLAHGTASNGVAGCHNSSKQEFIDE